MSSNATPNLASLMAQAAGHYAAGRTGDAAGLAREVLRLAPGLVPALHLLAAARLAEGALDEGAALLEQVLAALPELDEVRLQLALTRAGQGRHDAVVVLLADLPARRPEWLEAYGPLAAAQWELGDRDGAIASYRGLVARTPDDGAAQRNLGGALRQNGAPAEAVAVLARAVVLLPRDLEAHVGLAEALAALARAAPPGGPEDAAASTAAQLALELSPTDPRSLLRLGVVLNTVGDLDQAIACLRAARRGLPDDPILLIELANALSRVLDHAGAAACYGAVLARDPDNVPANLNLALLHLLAGDFATGWAGYEWRRRLLTQLAQPQDPRAPAWIAPADLRGTTVRLVLEQGHGDTLHFIRYAALLAERGARVEVVMPTLPGETSIGPLQAALTPLLVAVRGVAVVLDGATLPPAEVTIPLLSLPRAFATTMLSIPAEIPYLSVPKARRAAWQARLAAGVAADERPRIGVVWSGSAAHGNDRHRSIPLQQFRRLLARRDLAFHALANQLRDGDAAMLDGLATAHAGIADFADTAALVEAMDLVITVDTAVAHLAGALGRPTWILLPRNPDWRWLLGRDDSPWYPTVRLFRQTAHQDWDGVLARVHEAIDATFPR